MKSDKWKTNGRITIIILLKVHITIHSIYHFESSELYIKEKLIIETIEAKFVHSNCILNAFKDFALKLLKKSYKRYGFSKE